MKRQSFRRRVGYALSGIGTAWKGEASFRFQVLAGAGALAVLAAARPAPIWWAMILLTVGAVQAAELMNTALEHVIDRLHPEIHPSIRKAKDCAAGAVLVLSLVSIGILIALLFDVLNDMAVVRAASASGVISP